MKALKLDTAFPENRLDRSVQGLIGAPVPRVDGLAKVTGTAVYSADYRSTAPAAIGYLITATVAGGLVEGIDIAAALRSPGVLAVLPRQNGVPVGKPDTTTIMPVPREVHHVGQLLAVVVAETFEAARTAAALVRVHYSGERATRFTLADVAASAVVPSPFLFAPNQIDGDTEAALAAAPVRLTAHYTTPVQTHAAMEPHVTHAEWQGEHLTLYASYQMLARGKVQLAKVLAMDPKQIRLVSKFVGGGFGGKTGMSWETIFAAQAARAVGRPVRIVMTRRQVFGATSRRSETIQTVELGATGDGHLTAIRHDGIVGNLAGDIFWEPTGVGSFDLYAAPNRSITHRLASLDLVRCGMMRAPGEGSGTLAFECAIDEIAEKLLLDPIAFRLLNEPAEDPLHHRPFSSRNLTACLLAGAQKFDWSARSAKPAQVRDGDWLIGMGVAAATRGNIFDGSEARVRLAPDGLVTVETDLTDIGTGSYTILAQIAGEMLGLPLTRVQATLGDTDLPVSAGSGGSWGAASTGTAVLLACEQIVEQIAQQLGVAPDSITFKDGMVIAANRSTAITSFATPGGLEGYGKVEPGTNNASHTQGTFGAHFVEVAVHATTGEIRMRRMLGVFAAGRILNSRLAHSQLMGGMIFGIGAALTEELVADHRSGSFVNGDLGEYLVPANADVPPIEVMMLPEHDDRVNPLRAKGIGELGVSGAGAAIGNAVYNACGVRVRDFPIRLDALIAHLPDIA